MKVGIGVGMARRRASSGPVAPAISNLAAVYVADPSTCFTDAAGTVRCADGDLVYRQNDISGNNNTRTQATSGRRLTLRKDGNNKWYLSTTGASSEGMIGGPTLTGSTTISFRAFQTALGNTRILQNDGPGAGSLISLRRSANSVFGNSSAIVAGGPLVADSLSHSCVHKKTAGGNWAFSIDAVAQSVLANTVDWGQVVLGYGFVTESFAGGIYGEVHTSSNVTGSELTTLNSYLAGLG
jgi:hypothetical protein